jgi:hypothetical protein
MSDAVVDQVEDRVEDGSAVVAFGASADGVV